MHAGDSAMKTGHYVIAIEQFQQAAELTLDDPVIFERLSESNWELGYQTRAINQMARAAQASDMMRVCYTNSNLISVWRYATC